MNVKYIVIGIVSAIILASGYLFLSQKNTREQSPAVENHLDADEPEDITELDESKTENVVQMILEDPSTIQAKLSDVSGGEGIGVGYLLRKDEMLYHYVQATLPEPIEGSFYEGWLVNKKPTLKFISTGDMIQESGSNFVLIYKDLGSYEGYNDIVITLETEKDETPEEHILEGTAQ